MSVAANPLLETTIKLGDREFRVRPTLRIVRRIEMIGPPLVLARNLIQGEIGLVAMANLLRAILGDDKSCPSAEGMQELLFEHGVVDQVTPVSEFLARCWAGNKRAAEAAEKQAREVEEGAGDPPQTAH